MPPQFEIRSLSYRYPDGRLALRDIGLEIQPGERIALVGQNGAGKTTLIKHFNGLYTPASGSLLYKGLPLRGDHLRGARLRIGMLFQDPDDQLFCNTLDEDVAFGPRNQQLDRELIEARVRDSLEKMGLTALRYKAPHLLSYGQKKRAAFATLLAMEPEVLLLDEPTANLDPKQERFFSELLRGFGGTLICISHDLPFLYGFCTRALVLQDGVIHHDFPMPQLVSHPHYLRDHGLDFTFRLSCCRDNDHGNGHHHEIARRGAADDPPRPTSQAASPSERPVLQHVTEAMIQLRDCSFRYADGTWGLRAVSLDIRQGERLAVMGENGAGKSTLVGCLAGMYAADGEYRLDGRPVTEKTRRTLWRQVGLAFQDSADQLFCPSCREEVAFGPRQLGLARAEIDERVTQALHLVRLEGFDERVPHHLSAGERKRLALAAVLAMRPRVLLLDEPTANLDPRSEELLCTILQQLDVTQLLISHDIDIVSLLCRRVLVMHQGRMIRDYPVEDFLHDERLMSINGLDYTYKNACCQEIAKRQGGS
jgi:energy-coupling factor transporter ATP-binding protein EcfA2